MFTEGFEQLFKTSKHLSNPLSEWNKTCTDMCRRIAQKNVELVGENVSHFSEQMKKLSTIRKPEELLIWQKEAVEEQLTTNMKYAQELIQASMANVEELVSLFQHIYGTLNESALNAAKTASKSAEKTGKKAAERADELLK